MKTRTPMLVVIKSLLLGMAHMGVNAIEPTNSTQHYLGIGLGLFNDYDGSHAFADLQRHCRWGLLSHPWDGGAVSDADGWPLEDASAYVVDGTSSILPGTYKITLKGQAQEIFPSFGSIINRKYDAVENRTTADWEVPTNTTENVHLNFTGTRRDQSPSAQGGFTDVHIWRPGSPANNSELFTPQFLTVVRKFHLIRTMDLLQSNGNPSRKWDDRSLMRWAGAHNSDRPPWRIYYEGPASSEGGSYPGDFGRGYPWELLVQLANQTDCDLWINVPVRIDEEYITKLAQLIRYGSDGVNPYTETEANPVWPPLNSDLKIYVEYGNEVWNDGAGFYCFYWARDQSDSVRSDPNHPISYDGVQGDRNEALKRFIAFRSSTISLLFRKVFGDDAMMARVRPILASQLGNGRDYLSEGLQWAEGFYGSTRPNNAVIRRVNGIWYGGGGAPYMDSSSEPIDAFPATMTAYFTGLPKPNFGPSVAIDSIWLHGFGLKNTAYEGGPEPGGNSDGSGGRLSSLAFSTGQIKDIATFSAKLFDHSDPVSSFLWNAFEPGTRELLTKISGSTANDEEKKTFPNMLVEELNRILEDGLIYEADRFQGVNLRDRVRNLLDQNGTAKDLERLNRMLLEDAYPDELSNILNLTVEEVRRYNSDPRMKERMMAGHDLFIANGGDLFCWYLLQSSASWEFVTGLRGVVETDTVKLKAIDEMRDERKKVETSIGIEVPKTINFVAPVSAGILTHGGFRTDQGNWLLRRDPAGVIPFVLIPLKTETRRAGPAKIQLNYQTAQGAEVEFLLKGEQAARLTVSATNRIVGSQKVLVEMAAGFSVLRLRVLAGELELRDITIRDHRTTEPPDFSPAPAEFNTSQKIELTSDTPGATIRYTTDDTIPTSSRGRIYVVPIPIESTTTIHAIAFKPELDDSIVISSTYTIDNINAGSLLGWDFTAAGGATANDGTVSSVSATWVAPGMQNASLTRGPGSSASPVTESFRNRGAINTSSWKATTLQQAKANGEYFEFKVDPLAGYTLTLNALNLAAYQQKDTHPGATLVVEYSFDGFATAGTSVGSLNPIHEDWAGTSHSLRLSGVSALQNITQSLSFRIWGFGFGAFEDKGLGQITGNNNDLALKGTLHTSYPLWLLARGIQGNDASPDADPDQDQIPNLVEYGFGSDPTTPNERVQVEASFIEIGGSHRFRLAFPRDPTKTDLLYTVEFSDDLKSWTLLGKSAGGERFVELGPVYAITEEKTVGSSISVAVFDVEPSSESTPRFFRLNLAPL